MAGGQERILRRRIKSVESTKKITRAMELIAATRVVKAQDRAASARPYSDEITSVIVDLLRAGAAKEHPLLRENPEANTAAFVVITSDRGMCGGYNTNVLRLAERSIEAARAAGLDYSIIAVGKKALKHFRFRGLGPSHGGDYAANGQAVILNPLSNIENRLTSHTQVQVNLIVPEFDMPESCFRNQWKFLR